MNLIELRKIIKELQTYAKKYGVEIRINSIETDEEGCMELLELYFDDDLKLPNEFTIDDSISYKITDKGLFFKYNYQREDLEDLPHWINDKKTIKQLIKYFSL